MRKFLKIAGWTFASLLVLLVLIIISLQTSFVQNIIAQRAVAHFSDRLDTKIDVENIRIRIPRSVTINGLFIEDQKQDTLWYSGKIAVELDMFGLLRNKLTVHSFLLEDVTARVSRTIEDERFNFEFIADAFAANGSNDEFRNNTNNTDGTPLTIDVKNINLKNIRAQFYDEIDGNDAQVDLGELVFELDEIDLADMKFSVSRFDLHGVQARVVQSGETEPVEREPADPADFGLVAKSIGLSSIDIEYRNVLNGDYIHLDLPALDVLYASFTLPDNTFSASSIKIDRTSFAFRSPGDDDTEDSAGGIDFSDLNIADLNLHVEDVRYMGETANAHIHLINFREQSGFVLEDLAARINIDERSARVDGLNIRTSASQIGGNFLAEYSSLEQARDNPGKVTIDLSLKESVLGFTDALLFQPDLNDVIHLDKAAFLTVSASINGYVEDMTIGNIEASLLDDTYLKTYGRIIGLPDRESAHFDFTLEEITTARDDIRRIVSAEMLPENVNIPQAIRVTGTYKGSITEFETFIDVRTTFGDIVAAMVMDMDEEAQRYNGNITVSRLHLGELLGDTDQFGPVSLTASVDGRGFEMESIDAMLDATIDHASLMGYNYNDLRIEGRFRNRHFTGYAGMDDPKLTFSFNGDVQFTDDDPVFAFAFDLEHADLQALQLVDEELSVRGMIRSDFRGGSLESFNGSFSLLDILIIQNEIHYPIDSLVVHAYAEADHHHLSVLSDIVTAEYRGSVNIVELPALMMDHINQYFELHHYEVEAAQPDQNFTFNIELLQPRVITDIVLPGLHNLSPAKIEGEYNGEGTRFNVSIDIPEITYEAYIIDSLRVQIDSDRTQLGFDFRASHISIPGMELTAPELYGIVEENIVSINVALFDDAHNTVFALGGLFESADTVYTFSLVPGELIINYDSWSVPEENFVRFRGDHLYVHNLRLERGGSRITANSIDDGTPAPPLEVSVRDFDISDIPRMIGNEDFTLAGMLNIRADISDLYSEMKLNIELLLENFEFNESEVGDIEMLVRGETPDRYDLEVTMTQHENRVHVAGYILTGDDAEEVNITVDIQNINLASIEGFTMGQLADMSGSLTGELTVSGSTASPDINGTINFRDAGLIVVQLNSELRLEDEVIAFDRDGIAFRNVTLIDSHNNRAVISGNVFTTDFTDYRFDLDIRSTDFTLMDTQRRHNEIFYGRIIIDSDIRIRGDQNLPVINADVGFKEGTDLTIFVPEQDPEVIERAGIVEFVRMDEYHQPIREADEDPEPVRSAMQGIDLTANIDVDMRTRVRVIIDEQAGDYLSIRGGGILSFGIDRSGLMSLAGRYEITEGSYQMTFYEVARRRFDIRPGSNITWTGDPMEAEVDMTAIYTARAQTVDLVADYISEERRPEFRRVLPYQVMLNMRGNLLAPDISFELDMPEEQRGALGGVPYQHIQRINESETERNKQVFALLVLNRFLPENPFDLGEGAGMTATARTSASRLLTQQLNALSGRYVRGFDIRFDVESYEVYTADGPEGRTELQLQVSRRFLEDRLIVELGGQFDLEGERARETELSDIAGDVAVEYMLTEDGRFRLRGFRKTEFTTLGEGEIIFTGLSLVYAREFNRLMDLFRRPRDVEHVPEPEIVGSEREE